MAAFDVVGLGCACVDELIYVDGWPAADRKQRATDWRRSIGGLTAVALVAAARLGARCAYAGVLGDDDLADFIRQSLAAEGIDLTHARTVPAGYAPASSPSDLARALWSSNKQLVAVTDGANGCWYATSLEDIHHQSAFPVEAQDTTGCGDVFHGAYAAALAQGLDPANRIRLASAASALKASRAGGQAGVPQKSEVEALLA